MRYISTLDTTLLLTASSKMISSVSLGDSGVEQDIQKEHSNTAMTSEDVTDSLQKAQSYLR